MIHESITELPIDIYIYLNQLDHMMEKYIFNLLTLYETLNYT